MTRCRAWRMFLPGGWATLPALLVAIGLLGAMVAFAADNPKKPAADRNVSPADKDFEALGFSIAPQRDGKARTAMFGVVGEGYKFVYVFDRSGSMGGSGREALRAVKAELFASLKHLDTIHQFQIVFYNERPVAFNPSGQPGRLAFATDANKQRAVKFVETIVAEGGTAHEDALRMAIRMQPDVIFFLTDGDDPKLSPAELERIRRLAAGITINAIEFGPAAQPEGQSFLAQLARQNNGQYAYVDLSKLAKPKDRAGAK